MFLCGVDDFICCVGVDVVGVGCCCGVFEC